MRPAALLACILALVLTNTSGLPGQAADPLPPRPRLDGGADIRDANAYYRFGLSVLDHDPALASDAFAWATRIDPTWAEAWYARHAALLLRDHRRLRRYWNRDERLLKSPEIRHIDSLYLYALTLKPFLYRSLDRLMLLAMVEDAAEEIARRSGGTNAEVRYDIDSWMQTAPLTMRAWRAYCDRNFEDALELYAAAIHETRRPGWLHAARGRILFQLNRADAALDELMAALDERREDDKGSLVYVYESKELLEQSVGIVYLRLGNAARAREAFGRALQENLAFFPAHVQLALLAAEAHDTATAVSEMELATQLRGDDPGLRYLYGYTLASFGRFAEAETQLRESARLDPDYASPHYVLGQVTDAQLHAADALEEYRNFLALASRQDPRRADAEGHVKELSPP
jgi:tetratricopeptide (TPR) repeat protein